MGRNGLRFVLLGLIGLVALGSLLAGQLERRPDANGGAVSSTIGQCRTGLGISVVVDFGNLLPQRQQEERCVSGSKGATGWQILKAAGFNVEGTSLYPTGFVCRINGQPTTAHEMCIDTPSVANGSWAYFYANAHSAGRWVFSGAGAGMRRPNCGDVEGWRFVTAGEPATTSPKATPMVQACPAD